MLVFTFIADTADALADQLSMALDQVEAFLEAETEETFIEYDEEGYYYDEEEDELFWVDFNTGEEFYYDEEQDAWFECDEIVEFLEEDVVFEDEQEVDFE
jgi:sugar lactone lactonase YvrE